MGGLFMPSFRIDRLCLGGPDMFYEVTTPMIYPDNPDKRWEFSFVDFFTNLIKEADSSIWCSQRVTITLASQKPQKEIFKEVNSNALDAAIAGRVLHILHWMKQTDKPVVLEKVWEMLQKTTNNSNKSNIGLLAEAGRNGSIRGYSRQRIIDRWKKYKCVSHLWCSAICCSSQNIQWTDIEHMPFFLSISEKYREFGENSKYSKACNNDGSILDSRSTWKVPKSYRLPPVSPKQQGLHTLYEHLYS